MTDRQSSPNAVIDFPKAESPGEYIERECREIGVSVAYVAKVARISRSTLFRWRQGRNSPYWDTYEKVRSIIADLKQEKKQAERIA